MSAIDLHKEQGRDARGLVLFDSIRQDVGYAIRTLRKNPGFSSVAILSLAIGIGANTTIFSFVNAILLTPLPYPDSSRLVVLHEHLLQSPAPLSVHPTNFVEWRRRAKSFEALALTQAPPLNVMAADGAEQISRVMATAELFDVFGVRPFLGRGFSEDETRPGTGAVVILGHGFWRRWFGGDFAVIGRTLAVQDGSLEIVGVAPQGFRIGSTEPDVLTPLAIDPARPEATGSRAFECYGRLAPGVGLDAARAELSAISSALRSQYRFNKDMGASVSRLHDFLVREARPGLRLLMAVVASVLAIACVNLAGLLMARGIGRRSELAVRAALGATRGRLVRQLLIESLVLAFCGGLVGLGFAYWATQALAALAAGALTAATTQPVRLDAYCLVLTFVISTAAALTFGFVPARQIGDVRPQDALRERTRGTGTRRDSRIKAALVVTEVALAVVLLIGGGLLLRTFSSLARVDLGFRPSGTITMGLFLGLRPAEVRSRLLDQILERVEALPGVKAAGTIQFLPLRGATCGTGFWREEHAAVRDPSRTLSTDCSLVSRGYFEAMGIPLLEGRTFDRRDRVAAPRVVMVNKAFAKRYYPDGRVVGQRILVQSSNQALAEIIGVAGDVRHRALTSDPTPTVFLLHTQTPGYITNLVVRAGGDAAATTALIRKAIHDVDPSQAAANVTTLEQDLARVLARPRLYAALVGCFALVSLLLAAIGVYGLVAHVVTQRTHEIGIRLALGATRRRVFFDVFSSGARLVAVGAVLGVAAALGLSRILSALVFGVSARDPVTYLVAVLTLSGVAVAAVIIPARRAARLESMTALRCE